MASLIEFHNVTVDFPGVRALDNVSLNIEAGEVHVLLGENGAGKSTLSKLLVGINKLTSGHISLRGEIFNPKNVAEAKEAKVAMIFQELTLFPELTIAENIFIDKLPHSSWGISWKEVKERAQKILNKFNINIDVSQKVKTLGIAQQQMVEIAKALTNKVDVMIMDEPTATLSEKEVEQLFNIIRILKENSVAIIYVSHRLEELIQIGDRISILRDGKYRTTLQAKNIQINELIKHMVGRSIEERYPYQPSIISDKVLLEVKNLNAYTANLNNISFYVKAGEVIGFAGLVGAGRSELMRVLFGVDKLISGQIIIYGKVRNIKSPRDAINNGIGFLTEDRKGEGLILNSSVNNNVTLINMDKILNFFGISRKKEKYIVEEYIDNLKIKTPSGITSVKSLSGGNQQKVVLAKWLLENTDIIIFDEPTRGIDVNAKVEIYKTINSLKALGKAIILISSELPEVIGLSDRIYVMSQGAITGEVKHEDAYQEIIMQLATKIN